MPLFRPNTVVLQPIFYMFTRCMLCMEKIDWNHGKIWKNQLNPWQTQWKLWKNRWKLWVNQWTPWKNWWTVQMANFSSKIQQSTGFCSKMQQIARKGAPDWRKQKTKNNQKKICTCLKNWPRTSSDCGRARMNNFPSSLIEILNTVPVTWSGGLLDSNLLCYLCFKVWQEWVHLSCFMRIKHANVA